MPKSVDLYKTWNEEDNEKLIIHQFQLGDSLIQQSRCLINNYEDQLNFSEEVRTFYSEATSHNIQLYEKKKDDHFLYQSFYFSEQSKAYILFNSLNNRELQDENHTSLYNELSDTQQLLSYYQARKNNNSLDSAKQFEINTSITNLLIRRDQLLSGINDNIFGNSNVKLGSFPDIKLKKNELLINYFDTGEELFAFLLQRDDLFFFKLEKKGTKDIIDSLRNYISYSKSNALSDPKRFQKIANIAFQKIIQPFSHKLEGMNLIISPDGYLNLIPFELLVRETKDLVSYSNIDYLIRNNNIQYTYSANILSILNQRSQNFQNQVLAISPQFNNTNSRVKNSIQWSPLPELNHTLTEIQNIGNYFDKVQQTGIEASETNFVLNADNFNILHLATHSINDFNDPMNSGVLFSKVPHDTLQDGVLYGYEIQFQRLNAEMVVLSACNTGVGKLVDGEGMISLANTFFYAGANSVVMSLWPVGDKSTSEIIKEFYRNLSEGYSKSESLRMAKLSYMETAPEIASSPYYWAGLVVNGNTRPIVSNSLDWYIWVTISFLLTGIGWIVYSWFGNRKQ
jgi:CHAT domain-containing protein